MVLNGSWLTVVLFFVVFAWIITLTFWVRRTSSHYNELTEGISKKNLSDALTKILVRQQELVRTGEGLKKDVSRLDEESRMHLSRIGLVRFNPFSDTGGSQSFTLALLDERNTGLVMTSLYARTGNRWYVKEVRSGAGVGIELSREETAAIKRAQLIKESEA